MAQDIGKSLTATVGTRPHELTGKHVYIFSKISRTWHNTKQTEMQSEIIMTKPSLV